MPLTHFPPEEVATSAEDALSWLVGSGDGYPRTWETEFQNDNRRGYVAFVDSAPAIVGYEALERDGVAVRIGEVNDGRGQRRVHFRLASKPLVR